MLLKIKILLFHRADRLARTVNVSQSPVILPVQSGHRPFNLGLILGPFGVGSFAFRASAPKAEWGLVLPTGTTLSLAETGLSFPLVAGIEAPELIVPALKETLGSACCCILEDCRYAVPLKETCPVLPVPVQVPGKSVFF